jgi:hypothetical protein
MESKKGGWRVYLAGDVLERTAGLSLMALRLLIALEQRARLDPSCFPGNAELASRVGCSARWVRNGLAELERTGWIHRAIDPTMRNRQAIVMLQRLDPDKPIGEGLVASRNESVTAGRIVPAPRKDRSGEGRHDPSAVNNTQGEQVPIEEPCGTYSASADCDPRRRGRATRSAGVARAAGKRSEKEPRMTAREMDAAILDYAKVAGTPTPRFVQAERDTEPFQAPTNGNHIPKAVPTNGGNGGLLAVGQRVWAWFSDVSGAQGKTGTIIEVHDFRDAPSRPGIRYRIRWEDGQAEVRYDYGNGGSTWQPIPA